MFLLTKHHIFSLRIIKMNIEAHHEKLDLLGVGIGPFNLGLASLIEPFNDKLKVKFFEQKEQFLWHEGMLILNSYLQVPFLADLVTMVDPTSRFSYLNFLKAKNRLYKFYCYERLHIPRVEYNQYCQWVAQQLDSLSFSSQVEDISYENGYYKVLVLDLKTAKRTCYLAKNLALGTGTQPSVPHFARDFLKEGECIHTSQFLKEKDALQKKSSITVIGGGQSAAECFLELLKDLENHDYKLNWFSRSIGFVPMEVAKLALEHFSPDYIKHFYHLDPLKKPNMLASQDKWYKGISITTLNEIFDLLYLYNIEDKHRVHLQARTALTSLSKTGHQFQLKLNQVEVDEHFECTTEAIIFGTGYRYNKPTFLSGIDQYICYDKNDNYMISEDYQVKTQMPEAGAIFVQNAEMHTHGVSSPDLGLGAFRNAHIVNHILKQDIYPIPEGTVFQNFGLPKTSL